MGAVKIDSSSEAFQASVKKASSEVNEVVMDCAMAILTAIDAVSSKHKIPRTAPEILAALDMAHNSLAVLSIAASRVVVEQADKFFASAAKAEDPALKAAHAAQLASDPAYG